MRELGRRRGIIGRVYDVLKFIGNGEVGRSRIYRSCGVNDEFFKEFVLGNRLVLLVVGKHNYGGVVSLTVKGIQFVKMYEGLMELLE